jgi:predicted dehydrogenase
LVEEGVYWSVDLLARRVLRVRWGDDELRGESVPVPSWDALERQHDAFLAAVRGERAYPVPGTEAQAVLALAERIRQVMT